MSKLTGLHSIFRKNSIYGANIGFHKLTFARTLGRWRCLKPRTTDLVVIEGYLISQVYMDEMLRPVVLPFCAITSDSTRPRKTMPELTSLELAYNNAVRIEWSVRSSDMSTILTCIWHFWTEGPTHNNGIKKPPASQCSDAGDIGTKSPVFRVWKAGASPNLLLTGDTFVTDEGILIFEMWCLRLSS